MKRKLLFLFTPALFLFLAYKASTNTSGPGGGYAGAPGENTCNTSGCHTGTLIKAGVKWSKIRFIGNFTGNGYIPDSTYTVTVTYRESGRARYGVQITCLTAANDPAGTFTATNSRVQRVTTTVSGKTREYISHTSTGSAPVVSDSVAWTFSWKAPSANLGNLKFYVALNAANNNSQSSGDSIYNRNFNLAPSSLLPAAIASADVSSSCTGYKVQFKGSGTNSPTSYSWSFPTGTPTNSTTQNPQVTYTTTGTKLGILTVRNSKGVSKPDTVRITVLQSPAASIGGPNSLNICPGDSIRLTANTVSGATYFWPGLNKSGISVFVKDSGSYTVRVTGTNTCMSTSAPVRVSLFSVPQTSLSLSSDSICSDQVLGLAATATGADSFLFYRNGSMVARQKSNIFVDTKPANGARYSARSKSSNGCLGPFSPERTLFVRQGISAPSPVVNLQKSDRIGFRWLSLPGALRVEVSADSGKTWKRADSDTSHLFSGLSSATDYRFYFRTVSPSPCSTADTSIIVSTAGCGGRVITVLHDDSICLGQETKIIIRGLSGARFGTSIGGNFSRDTVYILKPTATANYTVLVKDSADLSCPDFKRSFGIRVDEVPAFSVNYDKAPDALCAGDTLLFTAASGFISYQIRLNGKIIANTPNKRMSIFSAEAKSGDSLQVFGRNGACVSSAPAVQLKYRNLPEAGFTGKGFVSFEFLPKDTSLTLYQWDFGDGNTSSAKKPTHTYGSAWYFKNVLTRLKVADAFNCSASDTLRVFVGGPDGVSEATEAGIRVYPIPANKELFVHAERHKLLGAVLFNVQGMSVREINVNATHLKMPLDRIQPGNYMLLLRTESGNFYRSVVIAE
jgi:PKD repeat protein